MPSASTMDLFGVVRIFESLTREALPLRDPASVRLICRSKKQSKGRHRSHSAAHVIRKPATYKK
jgi:hypothetical protein